MPADSALVRADGLSVNESILTGESEAVSKQSGDPADTRNDLHKKNVVYAGTAVLHGSAEAVVIATGTRTQMGQISAMLQEVKQDLTPRKSGSPGWERWWRYSVWGCAALSFWLGYSGANRSLICS